MTEQLKVFSAINKITSALAKEGIGKGRKNIQQGYAFRGIDDIYNTLSSLLAENHLCIIPEVVSREQTERQSVKGGMLIYTSVNVKYTIVSAEDGSSITAGTYGEAMDSADKSTNKAMSAAYKYLCLQLFCIPTEGDNDADANTPEPSKEVLNHHSPRWLGCLKALRSKQTTVAMVLANFSVPAEDIHYLEEAEKGVANA